MEQKSNLSKELKEFRIKHNLTQQSFSDKIGVNIKAYQMWETRGSMPKLINQIKLEQAMRKIESSKSDINSAIERLEGIKNYKKIEKYWEEYNQHIDDEFNEDACCFPWKYIILLIILVFIFTVLY